MVLDTPYILVVLVLVVLVLVEQEDQHLLALEMVLPVRLILVQEAEEVQVIILQHKAVELQAVQEL